MADSVDWLAWANEHGIWDLAQTVLLVASAIVGGTLLLRSKRRVRHLNFFTEIRTDHTQFPLRLVIEFRNYTGRSVVISNAWMRYLDLKPPAGARGDTPSGEIEIKFPSPDGRLLSEVEWLLRNKKTVATYAPLDPGQSQEEAIRALEKHRVGRISMTLTWLDQKPRSHRLTRPI